MLKLLLGKDWVSNRNYILQMITQDVANEKDGRILMVPELISHDTERRLCQTAGDTVCRFAEVLSFTQLARRVSENLGASAACMDNGGRVVAMASVTRQLHSKLKAYAAVETRPEFLAGLVDMVDEFKRCCITSDMLLKASKETSGSLAQKLEELALILEAYDGICAQGKRDPRDQMTWLLEELEDCDFAQKHVFYIDGFPDFTRQHMAILEHLMRYSPCVVVSLNCDCVGSEEMAFAKAGETAKELVRLAKRNNVPVDICEISPREIPMHSVTERLYEGKLDSEITGNLIHTYQAESVFRECQIAAEKILELVQNGARYRDISIVCADLSAYKTGINFAFHRYGIPTYISGTESITEKPAISTLLSALDAALGGFDFRDVMRYLKSVLSPLDLETCDALENYCVLWKITGNRWLDDWTWHPSGLGGQWSDADRQQLEQINAARRLAIKPLERLNKQFANAKTLNDQVKAIYDFLDQVSFCDRMEQLAADFDARNDNRNAQILNQLWDIVLNGLEQMQDVLGNTIWDADTFSHLFKLLLSQYDVGTIPPVLDAVIVGPVSAMRCQETKHLFILGATEENLPGFGGAVGSVLTDQERTALRQIGVPLTGGALDGLQISLSEIYGVFCGTECSVYMSYSAGQPSFIYKRLCGINGGETAREMQAVLPVNTFDVGAYLARFDAKSEAQKLGVEEAFEAAQKSRMFTMGELSNESVKALYGSRLNLSASQIDRHAECRLSYFLNYGLRLKERKAAEIDPAEFGTYVHAVLEGMARAVVEKGGFRKVTLEETQAIAREISSAYAQERFGDLKSERQLYLFNRNVQELEMIVEELWQELHESDFSPIDFELAFGDGKDMPAICIPNAFMDAQLRGFVDRVDAWESGDSHFYRVVDYKTGKKDFDYCDVFNGIGLQMLLYLFALQENGESLLGSNPVPAGVQYFPARVPLVAADSVLNNEEADAERLKLWKRKGLILQEDAVLQAMENGDDPNRLPYTRKKDGALVGDLANREQFQQLKDYIFKLLANMVREIATGKITPNPYTRGNSHNACTFCPFGSVCHKQNVEDRRNYKAMSAQRFWEEIGKETSLDG